LFLPLVNIGPPSPKLKNGSGPPNFAPTRIILHLTQALCREYPCMFNKKSVIVVGNNPANIGVYICELFRALKAIFII
jgi:hypothetical protein